jgi:hypothetical protein
LPNSIYQGIDYNKSFIQGRQNIQYYDIKDMDILIEDNSAFSSQYFKIIQSPTQLEGGKNALFLLGDSEMLEKDTEILIEVLDANGDNIFVETTEYGPDRLWDIKFSNTIQDAKGGKRCIAIWLQEDAAPGIGMIYVAGIAAKTPSGEIIARSLNPDISKYADEYNVRWSKEIVIEPFRPNSSELIYLDYDRNKFASLKESNAISASMYEATHSYNYITSDTNGTLNQTLYYKMASTYNDYQSALESDGTTPNPIAGERIAGWKELTEASGENFIMVGVATGSGRQIGYTDPGPVHVWGSVAQSATKNVSQSLPTAYGAGVNGGGAGLNIQVDNVDALLDSGIISGHGFAIDGRSMWRLLASHSFWAPNESHSVGNYLYSKLYESAIYHTYGDNAQYGPHNHGSFQNFPGGSVTFGPVAGAPISISNANINTGWVDFCVPSVFSGIDQLVDSGAPAGWHPHPSIGGLFTLGDYDDGYLYLGGMPVEDAFNHVSLVNKFQGNDMSAYTNAPIWTRFSASNPDSQDSVESFYSMSQHRPHNPPLSGDLGTQTNPYKHILGHQRSMMHNFAITDMTPGFYNPTVYDAWNTNGSSYKFYNQTQKMTTTDFEYNRDGTNQPSNMCEINDVQGDGGLNPQVNYQGPGTPMTGLWDQKWMLWYKPQYDYQTIPFRGTISPNPTPHSKAKVKVIPKPWSFKFTRSALVHSPRWGDYFTINHEQGNIVLDGGMPYFDGEMAGDGEGFAAGPGGGGNWLFDFDDFGGPVGPGDPWPPTPNPDPTPEGNKIQLPGIVTMLYYDNPSTMSTFSNNFFVGDTGGGSPSVFQLDDPDTLLDTNIQSIDGAYYKRSYVSFMNEWTNAGLNVSISYAQQPQQYQVNNIVSYLIFNINNFQPITGDVYKVKAYKRPKSGIKSWEFLDEAVVERVEKLVSESNSRPIQSVGFFDEQATIDNNWYTGSGTYLTHNFPDTDAGGNAIPVSTSIAPYNISWNGTTTYVTENNPNANYPPFPTSSISDALVLGSIIPGFGSDLVSQSWDNLTAAQYPDNGNGLLYYPEGYGNYSAPLNSPNGNPRPGKCRSFYDFRTKNGYTLSPDTSYELSFIAHAKQYAAFQTGSDGAPSGWNPACVHIYMTGSSFPLIHEKDPLYEHNFGKYVKTLFIHPDQASDGGVKSFGKQFVFFQTDAQGITSNNNLRFIVTGGQWIFSEISIKNVRQTGFTPEDFRFAINIGTEQMGEFMDFKLEMYNWYGTKANKDLYLPNYFIQGGNTWTNNLNNVNAGNTTLTEPGQILADGGVLEGIDLFGANPNSVDEAQTGGIGGLLVGDG